ncbi:hypothetical protein J4E81_000948 [Alternaria sp. BMP 2799]|nr:hypothetical protein J4E81_000948 [Alternaria sp. BMP 2799]
MRLLHASGDDFELVEFVRYMPTYAILSHTWGADEDEVTFKDIHKGKGKGKKKPGYAKLQFCAAQAAKDKLEFFWVDTCCIDKSSSAELAEAINSMFKWYRDSTACYVYLSDVPSTGRPYSQSNKQPSFKGNRWFTRGWTLQELLAPRNVVFFSIDGTRIGDKTSLAKEIASETNIPVAALENGPSFMLKYPIEERMRWARHRGTKREEDAAAEGILIFSLVVGVCYISGKLVCLQEELQRLNDIVFDNAMMQDMRSLVSSVAALQLALQHVSATVGVLDIDNLLQPDLQQSLHKPSEDHSYAPWSHKPYCMTSSYLPTLGQKYCVYTSNTTGPHGLSLIFPPKSAHLASEYLNDNPLDNFLTQKDAERLYFGGQPWKIVDIPGKAKGVVATRRIKMYETFMVDQAAVVVDMGAEKALSEAENKKLMKKAVDQLLVPAMIRDMSSAHAGKNHEADGAANYEEEGGLEEAIMKTNAYGSTVAEVSSRALYPLISVGRDAV